MVSSSDKTAATVTSTLHCLLFKAELKQRYLLVSTSFFTKYKQFSHLVSLS